MVNLISREPLRAPFPWFGGKSSVAQEVWSRFGDIDNYVEPFFGSGAVLLGRPGYHPNMVETVNDKDCLLANFWRAVKAAPDEVAHYADWPVNEAELHARHAWLLRRMAEIEKFINGDPEFYDARAAGYWVYGISTWIGGGFCSGDGPWVTVLGDNGHWALVHREDANGPNDASVCWLGLHRQLPHLGDNGKGIHSKSRRDNIYSLFEALSYRLRNVRVCCGDWSRVLTKCVTTVHGVTGVFLDPPYGVDDRSDIYRCESRVVARDVLEWCIDNGGNNMLRIALCGYEGEGHEVLEDLGWQSFAWKAIGGYGNQSNGIGRDNAKRERIWFSPSCVVPARSLFDGLE